MGVQWQTQSGFFEHTVNIGEQSFWNGNFYALAVTERLGLEEKGGLLRVGLTHYNTQAEIDRLVTTMLRLLAK